MLQDEALQLEPLVEFLNSSEADELFKEDTSMNVI